MVLRYICVDVAYVELSSDVLQQMIYIYIYIYKDIYIYIYIYELKDRLEIGKFIYK